MDVRRAACAPLRGEPPKRDQQLRRPKFMSAITERQTAEFVRQAMFYAAVFVASTVIAVVARFLEERLGLLWRDSLTRRTVKLYLDKGAYYSLASAGGLANPDQRIADDARTFTASALSFFLMAFNTTLTIVAFAGVIISISPLLSVVTVRAPAHQA